MKILETALFSQNPQYLQELLNHLPLEKETVLDLEVYRFEIDEELVILMYNLNTPEKIPIDVLEHLSRHLSALLVVTDERPAKMPANLSSLIDELAGKLSDKAAVVAVRTEKENLQSLNAGIAATGFYLSSKGRVVFWNPETPDSLKQVWNMLWNTLQVHASVE